MQAIINFFTSIFEIIQTVVEFIVSFFEDVIYIVKTLGDFVIKAPTLFSFLPPAVLAIFLIGLSIVIIYKVVGRD